MQSTLLDAAMFHTRVFTWYFYGQHVLLLTSGTSGVLS
jgi:hypothetical protein